MNHMQSTEFSRIKKEIDDSSKFGRLNARIFYQAYPINEDFQTLQDQKITDLIQKLDQFLQQALQPQEKVVLIDLINSYTIYLKEKSNTAKDKLQKSLIGFFDFIIKKTEGLRIEIRENIIKKGDKTAIGIFVFDALTLLNETHGFFREVVERDISLNSKLLDGLIDNYLNVWKSISSISEKAMDQSLDAIADSQISLNDKLRTARLNAGFKPIITKPSKYSEVIANAVVRYS